MSDQLSWSYLGFFHLHRYMLCYDFLSYSFFGMENSLFQGERILVNNGVTVCVFPLWHCGIITVGQTALYKKRISLFSIIRLICQNLLFPGAKHSSVDASAYREIPY